MSDKHLSSQFDADLNAVSSKVLEMGGLVESQIVGAMYALNEFDREAAEQVVAAENAQRDGSRDRPSAATSSRAASPRATCVC
jgi:phosphate uptake regulator